MRPITLISCLFFILSILFFTSCKSNSIEDANNLNDTIQEDHTSLEDENNEDETTVTTAGVTKNTSDNADVKEAQKEIEKKYGEQWDFCTCIQKSDSVNNALMAANDDEFDKVMARSEFIDSKCKTMLIQPNSTPEERLKHEKKVKQCLKNMKK
ncbi:MAG: hypothetical protein H3C31_00045 [Brumimicrobium sp.]|nr:hypothetical protein [Brumimicrobium sp.]MCO5268032.1 hypothetical protein [Brumimicrobium sp.]